MKPEEFWQNFELGVEIDIASTFIYDGLNNLHQMDTFYYETEIFNFLYNISVGVERFLKVAIILEEFNDETEPEEYEKSLINHNHSELLSRLSQVCDLKLGKPHLEFISLLSKFYKSFRYDRYSLKTVYELAKEKEALTAFLSKHIKLEKQLSLSGEVIFKNNFRSKRYIGNLLSKIITQTYDIITKASNKKNIYTYETRYGSKAYKLLLGQQFDFQHEEVLWKELLIFMLSTEKFSSHLEFIKNLEPLDFDIALLGEYLEAIGKDTKKITVTEELDHLYDEISDKKGRFEALQLLGESVSFNDFQDDEDME